MGHLLLPFPMPLFLASLYFLLQVSQCTVFTVGGDKGWVVGAVNYTQWAANHTFYAGDTLVFNYLEEFHSVMEVTKESYESCDTESPVSEYHDGHTRMLLKQATTYYFICGKLKHCPLGQKLEISVLSKPSPKAPAPATNKHLLQHSPPAMLKSSADTAPLRFCNLVFLWLVSILTFL